jgi:hypothetical protein
MRRRAIGVVGAAVLACAGSIGSGCSQTVVIVQAVPDASMGDAVAAGDATGGGPSDAPSPVDATGTDVSTATGSDAPVDAPAQDGQSPTDAHVTPDSPGAYGWVVTPCSGGAHTSISGHVYDPANANAVANAVVYVPGVPLSTLLPTPYCGSCSSLYAAPFASALTDASGAFQVMDVPSGSNVPLVVQIGKWRMKYTIGTVTSCQDNPQADHSLRLPRNHTEGDLPQIAVSTGSADSVECVLRRIGVDATEYVSGAGTSGGGHVHIFTGTNSRGPGASTSGSAADPNPSTHLWDSLGDITPYDLVLLSCEGAETNGLADAGRTVLWNYTQNGGRVIATHYHYSWFTPTGPFSTVSPALATWQTGFIQDNDPIGAVIATTTTSGAAFPEGQIFAGWLADAGATASGKLYPVHYTRDNATHSSSNTLSQVWLTADNSSANPGNAQLLSFDTPPGGSAQCGRVVYTDIHVGGGPNNSADPNTDYPGFVSGVVPSGCASHALTAQEKVYEYMIFSLSSCLTPIGQNPATP